MKKSQLKRTLALCLIGVMLFAEPAAVFAGTIDAVSAGTMAQAEDASSGSDLSYLQRPLGEPLTDVTEDEALAFERGLALDMQGVTGADTELSKNAKKKAMALVSLYQCSSVQYALMQNGELVLSDAYGTDDAKKKTKVTTDSVYGIASISKMFVTTAVMQLVEDGKIDLDAPVVSYIPEFTMKDARYKDITVRMLLNHSSGLLGGDLENAILFDDSDTRYHDRFLEKLAGESLKAAPGAYSVYCNDGFMLAEIVVERVSGMTFTDYLQENIFTPLGLDHTRTPLQLGSADAVAGAYMTKGAGKLPTEYFNTIGTGGIYSSAEDLCSFGMTFTEHNGKLLSGDSVAATMVQEGRKGQWCEEYSGMLDFGLGWDSVDTYPFADYGITAMEKGGDSVFYHGELLVIPEYDLSVAVLTSGGSSAYGEIFSHYLAEEFLKEQGKLSEETIDSVATKYTVNKTKVPDDLKIYDGYYTSMAGTYQVKTTANAIKLVNLSAPDMTMKFTYSKDGYFVYPGGVQALKFVTENGKKYMMAGTYSTLPGIGICFVYQYTAQKTATKKLSKTVKSAWQKRDDKLYFRLTEKYSSVYYEQGGIALGLDMDSSQPGYFYNDKIVDANHAVEFTDIPMQGSRDARNYSFITDDDGREYLVSEGIYAICEDGLKNLSAKSSFSVKINSKTGYAKWYKISKKNAGKTISVTLPKGKGATVAVYDAEGNVKLNTYVSGKTSVKLPKNGYIVFAGDAGSAFQVKIK